jgi:DNA polymerase-1
MVKVDRALKAANMRSKMVLQIHDELVFDAPRDELEMLTDLVRREMSGAVDFGVPLEVEVGYGSNWLEAH